MPPATRAKPIADVVYGALADEILDGTLAPGDALQSERLLAERFAVNRHAIREAMKRLQQAGLVRVTHGGATRVLDWRATGGLDLLARLAEHDALGPELLRAGLEMRRSIGADAARLCAKRAPAHVREALQRLVLRYPDGKRASADAYEHLWGLIVDGAGNLAYRLALNSLVAATGAIDLKDLTLSEATDRKRIGALVDAIAAGKPNRAAKAADALLEKTLDQLPKETLGSGANRA